MKIQFGQIQQTTKMNSILFCSDKSVYSIHSNSEPTEYDLENKNSIAKINKFYNNLF